MSTLVQNSGDNRSTTGVVVALLFSEKKLFIILLKLELVSLLFFFCPSPFSYTDMRNSTRILESHCMRLLLYSPAGPGGGVQVLMDSLASEDSAIKLDLLDLLLRRTLRTEWKTGSSDGITNWRVLFFRKFNFQPKKLIFAIDAMVNFVSLKHSLI